MSADPPARLVPIFDLDGTLLDSDAALRQAFLDLGVDARDITYGHVVADECQRLGIEVEAYLDAYDERASTAYPGADALVTGLERWAVCSNKADRSGRAELDRLGWRPEVSLFASSFGGPKHLAPVLAALALLPDEVLFVGDTAHDRTCAAAAGVTFALAGWNERAVAERGDVVLDHPSELLAVLDPASPLR